MISASGVRIHWTDLPGHVRVGIEEILSDRVVSASSQPGGFSPGTADRVKTASGRRAFVKAVHPSLNEFSPHMHRAEARYSSALPPDLPAPRLLGAYDDGDWVALVFEDVEGRHPALPWRADELEAVLSTLRTVARALTPLAVPDAPSASSALASDLRGWERVAADPPADLDPWAKERLDQLIDLAETGIGALDGDTGAHTDLRPDNLLVRPDGSVVIVDWPHLCRGAAWLDSTMLMVGVRMHGGHDTDALLGSIARHFAADLASLRGVLAGMAGFFIDGGRRPIPGLPTVAAFRQAQGDALVRWLAEWLD